MPNLRYRFWLGDPDDTMDSLKEIKQDNRILEYQEEIKPGTSKLFDEWVSLGKPHEFFHVWMALKDKK